MMPNEQRMLIDKFKVLDVTFLLNLIVRPPAFSPTTGRQVREEQKSIEVSAWARRETDGIIRGETFIGDIDYLSDEHLSETRNRALVRVIAQLITDIEFREERVQEALRCLHFSENLYWDLSHHPIEDTANE